MHRLRCSFYGALAIALSSFHRAWHLYERGQLHLRDANAPMHDQIDIVNATRIQHSSSAKAINVTHLRTANSSTDPKIDAVNATIQYNHSEAILGLLQNATLPQNTTTNTTHQEKDPPIPHPHAGARFPNGTWGYVADVTAVKKRMLSLYMNATSKESIMLSEIPQFYLPLTQDDLEGKVCGIGQGQGSEKSGGWELLTNKVQVRNSTESSSRILCAVYTTAQKTANIQAIGETYGWRCDGFFAASTQTNEGLGAIDLPHFGKEEYGNMWQKTRSILSYMHDNYLEDFDFFYLAGDDTHLIVENLKAMLASMGRDAVAHPLYLGHWIPSPTNRRKYFVGGGAGYVLNRHALQMVVEGCLKHFRPDAVINYEDRALGMCLSSMGVVANSSVDDTGAQTFHGMDTNFVATFNGVKGDKYFSKVYRFWAEHWGWRAGLNITSPESVSFHNLKTPDMMKRHHAILYNSCPNGTALFDALHATEVVPYSQ